MLYSYFCGVSPDCVHDTIKEPHGDWPYSLPFNFPSASTDLPLSFEFPTKTLLTIESGTDSVSPQPALVLPSRP